jgi:hypothetical protein
MKKRDHKIKAALTLQAEAAADRELQRLIEEEIGPQRASGGQCTASPVTVQP